MRHRIFIAVNLPEQIKKKLENLEKETDKLFPDEMDGPAFAKASAGKKMIRWTKKENLHITLIFLGYLLDQEILKVCQITKAISSKYQPFSINLNKICYGPPKKIPPRMVWVTGEKSEILLNLKENLEKSLVENVRFSSENREFSSHLTLGRIKTWLWRRMESEERPEIEREIDLNFEVNSIEVMESKMRRTGAEYSILESVKLTGGDHL